MDCSLVLETPLPTGFPPSSTVVLLVLVSLYLIATSWIASKIHLEPSFSALLRLSYLVSQLRMQSLYQQKLSFLCLALALYMSAKPIYVTVCLNLNISLTTNKLIFQNIGNKTLFKPIRGSQDTHDKSHMA